MWIFYIIILCAENLRDFQYFLYVNDHCTMITVNLCHNLQCLTKTMYCILSYLCSYFSFSFLAFYHHVVLQYQIQIIQMIWMALVQEFCSDWRSWTLILDSTLSTQEGLKNSYQKRIWPSKNLTWNKFGHKKFLTENIMALNKSYRNGSWL